MKLACINWEAHLEPVIPEGLSKQPLDGISRRVASMGFNCVRLTWPIYLATNETFSNTTVRRSLQGLGLNDFVSGVQYYNPSIIDKSRIDAFKAVVTSLGNNNVMVIIDNHVSRPSWCCSDDDGNGFFNDQYFNPDEWIQGLTKMATLFKGVPNVIGMSLRNELRGSRQNPKDWYMYMQNGAEAVHKANGDVLVILSGLRYNTDLSFVRDKPVSLSFSGKLVFEMHWYAFFDSKTWDSGSPDQVCSKLVDKMMSTAGYLQGKGFPLFVSEFGVDQRGTNVNDNKYLNCFLATAALFDWDWALWTLAGSYYFTQGQAAKDEFYGLLNEDWNDIRNKTIYQKIIPIQYTFQGPGYEEQNPHKVIFHPSTGLCVLGRQSQYSPLKLGPCAISQAWDHTPEKSLTIQGTYLCLEAHEEGKPASVGASCNQPNSKWEPIPDHKLHVSTKSHNGASVCLDVDSTNTIVTNSCKCLNDDSNCDAGSQWFALVDRTRRPRLGEA